MAIRADINSGGGGSSSGSGLLQVAAVKLTSGNITTGSATFVDLTGATVTLTTGAHRCIVYAIIVGNSSNGSDIIYDLLIDGVSQSNGNLGFVFTDQQSSLESVNFSFSYLTDVLSAASHTIKIQWRTTGGTATTRASNSPLWLQVIETGLTT